MELGTISRKSGGEIKCSEDKAGTNGKGEREIRACDLD